MIVNFLDTRADGSQNFVWNCLQGITQHGDGQMVAKDFHHVTFLTGNARNVYHCHIHTDIANVRSPLTIDKAIAGTTPQMTIQSVGIANRDGSDDGVTRQDSLATIAYGLFLRHMAQLEDGGLEC